MTAEQLLIAIVGGTIGLFFASLLAPLREWLIGFFFGPKLKIECSDEPQYKVEFDKTSIRLSKKLATATGHEVYVRARVTNQKSRPAKNCRAYLIGVEKYALDGSLIRSNYVDSIPLSWSYTKEGDDRRTCIDIMKGVPHYLDIAVVSWVGNDVAPRTCWIQTDRFPAMYKDLFAHTKEVTYRLTIAVVAEGTVAKKPIEFELNHKGFLEFKIGEIMPRRREPAGRWWLSLRRRLGCQNHQRIIFAACPSNQSRPARSA